MTGKHQVILNDEEWDLLNKIAAEIYRLPEGRSRSHAIKLMIADKVKDLRIVVSPGKFMPGVAE